MNEKIKKRIRYLLAKRHAQEPPQREHQEPIVYPMAPNDPIFFVSLDEMAIQMHPAPEANEIWRRALGRAEGETRPQS
ncbi:hypothetical protein FALBO_13742 [Fusarium albosuccineum]|uniref:Uncharacterized protein n=1 Tax=Fusarium albosuccineum TaxID=1237068 RepID=A0A8H4L0Z1_9HYPO|nr:hypothetical protein FALBO_13742 [Fusarium albosuccineum]